MKYPKIKDVIQMTPGFFQLIPYPMWSQLVSSEQLDAILIDEYGDMKISPMMLKYVNNDAIQSETLRLVAIRLYAKHMSNWQHYYNILLQDYNPTANSDRTETETISINRSSENTFTDTHSGGVKETRNLSGTDTNTESGSVQTARENTRTDNLTETTATTDNQTTNRTGNDSDTTSRQLYGFGSDSAQDESKETVSKTIDETDTVTGDSDSETKNSGTVTDDGSETVTYNDHKNSRTTSDSGTVTTEDTSKIAHESNEKSNETHKREFVLKGSIGVVTPQQMLQYEVDFWEGYNFVTKVVRDVVNDIALRVWG